MAATPADFEVQKQHVKRTWAMAKGATDIASVMFYRRLFELVPEVMVLFKEADSDDYLKRQGRRLFRMITRAVELIDEPVELFPLLEEAGGAHVGYGVKFAHYDKAGEALLWTLETALGKEVITEEVKMAWLTVWLIIRANMLTGQCRIYEEQLAEQEAAKSTSSGAACTQKEKVIYGLGLAAAAALGGLAVFVGANKKSSSSS